MEGELENGEIIVEDEDYPVNPYILQACFIIGAGMIILFIISIPIYLCAYSKEKKKWESKKDS